MEILLSSSRRPLPGGTDDLFLVQGKDFSDKGRLLLTPTVTGAPVPFVTTLEEKFTGIGSISFTAGRVAYSLPPLLLQDFFLDCWAKLSSNYNTVATHLVGAGDSITIGTWNLAIVSSKVAFAFATPGSRILLTGGANIVVNTWYHLAVARKGSTFYLFINGVLIGTATSTASIDYAVDLTIGDRLNGNPYGQYPTRGYIGAVRIMAKDGFVPPTASFEVPTAPYPERL